MKKIWLHISINGKLNTMIGFLFAVISLVTALNLYILNFSIGDIGQTLSDISACERTQEALGNEENCLRSYLENNTPENRKRYEDSCAAVLRALNALPDDYLRIGADRFGRTYNLRNAYESYAEQRDLAVSELSAGSEAAVQKTYAVFDVMDYLDQYIQSILQLTVQAGSTTYESRNLVLQFLPYIQIAMFLILFLVTTTFGRALSGSIVTPLEKLAESAGQIEKNNFSGEDVRVENQDELGILVTAFDRMKHAMEQHISTLREKQELEERLHREEVERMELQNRLETTRLDLLQSQINPHFLFNTLNTICGMAELEEAETTNRMIRSLSNIFRYNLHTTEAYLSLTQEISVCEDYIYLQQMRFGDRVQYQKTIEEGIDTDAVIVPAFLLQPLIENAIGHGISGTESGGSVSLHIYREDKNIVIAVEDTGTGIPKERLHAIREALRRGSRDSGIGIGLGNTYERISRNGSMEIESTEGSGTCIKLTVNQGPETGNGSEMSQKNNIGEGTDEHNTCSR